MSIDENAFNKALEIWERKALEGIQRGHILNAEEEGRIIIEAYEQAKESKQPSISEEAIDAALDAYWQKHPDPHGQYSKRQCMINAITALTPYLNLEK